MNLYSESNGTSAARGYCAREIPASTPILAASTTRAASVGSPVTVSSSLMIASEHSVRPSASGVKSGTSRPAEARSAPAVEYPVPSIRNHSPEANILVAVIRSSVKVPVLSLLIALVHPRVSTSVRLRTTALALARRCAP